MVQLVGPDALQDQERLIVEVGRILRQDFLQQNGFDEVDASCSLGKAYGYARDDDQVQRHGARPPLKKAQPIDDILGDEVIEKINRARYVPEDEFDAYKDEALEQLDNAFAVAA